MMIRRTQWLLTPCVNGPLCKFGYMVTGVTM